MVVRGREWGVGKMGDGGPKVPKLKKKKKDTLRKTGRTSLVAQWLRLHASFHPPGRGAAHGTPPAKPPLQKVGIQSLVGELRACRPCGKARERKRTLICYSQGQRRSVRKCFVD